MISLITSLKGLKLRGQTTLDASVLCTCFHSGSTLCLGDFGILATSLMSTDSKCLGGVQAFSPETMSNGRLWPWIICRSTNQADGQIHLPTNWFIFLLKVYFCSPFLHFFVLYTVCLCPSWVHLCYFHVQC